MWDRVNWGASEVVVRILGTHEHRFACAGLELHVPRDREVRSGVGAV
jgi:hypothetical protein